MKVRPSVKVRCENCKVVRRAGRVHIIGKTGEWYCIEFGAAKKPGFAKNLAEL